MKSISNMRMKLVAVVLGNILAFSAFAHEPTSSYSRHDPNLCQKLEKGIDNGVFPDGMDMHNYYEKCGFENAPKMADSAIDKMESFLRKRMGPDHPFNRNNPQ